MIVDLTHDIAELAGEIDVERKVRIWGIADSIILATARKTNAKIVTGDKHFADLKDEIIFLDTILRTRRGSESDVDGGSPNFLQQLVQCVHHSSFKICSSSNPPEHPLQSVNFITRGFHYTTPLSYTPYTQYRD